MPAPQLGLENSRHGSHRLSRRRQDHASQSHLVRTHGKKFAVIVNEFGEIGIDNDLVVNADEEVFAMNNRCICCTVRGDLVRIIDGLMRRKGKFDAIIVETTGLADPCTCGADVLYG